VRIKNQSLLFIGLSSTNHSSTNKNDEIAGSNTVIRFEPQPLKLNCSFTQKFQDISYFDSLPCALKHLLAYAFNY